MSDSPIKGMTQGTYETMLHKIRQLDGRTVGLLSYSSNTHWDRSKNKYLILAEDIYAKWEIRYIVEVSDMAFLSLWHNGEMVGDEVMCWADDAPMVAVEKLLKTNWMEGLRCKCGYTIGPEDEVTIEGTARVKSSGTTTLTQFYDVGVEMDAYESWDEYLICPKCGAHVPLNKPEMATCHR